MTTVLIVESNAPDLVAKGKSGAAGFVNSFSLLAPAAVLRHVAPYHAALAESDLEGVDGVVFTGSGVNWSTDATEAAPLRKAMETVFQAGLPVWGSCNGMQLAAVVLGGSVRASPNGQELGLARDIQRTEAGARHPMLSGRRDGFAVPCLHRDEVATLPEGATLLAGNVHSPVQAMVYEAGGVRFWGTQYHPELSRRDVADGLRGYGLFQEGQVDMAALEQAETDAEQVDRLRELANWVAMITHVKRGPAGPL